MRRIAKTIEILLPDGDPKGIKVASITSRTVEVTYVPRKMLDEAKLRQNLASVGVYILVGVSEEHAKPEVYIGEAENCLQRILQHNAGKDFWQYALIITSRISQFTKAHGKFLEWLCYDEGKAAERCIINNGNIPTKPFVSESMEADLHDSFETITTLVATLGLPLFLPARETNEAQEEKNEIFFISRKGVQGQGVYTTEGFVVLAGSQFHKEIAPSLNTRGILSHRQQLINDQILIDKGEYYELTQDTVFSSPSNAGASVTGRSTNGWTDWKLKNGKTLSEIYRSE